MELFVGKLSSKTISVHPLLFVLAIFVLLFSGFEPLAHAKKGLDECFETALTGKNIAITCLTGHKVMTDIEIEKSIAQFQAFEKSDSKEKVFREAEKRAAWLEENPIPIHPSRKKITEQDLKNDRTLSIDERKNRRTHQKDKSTAVFRATLERERIESHLTPEIRSKIGYIQGDRYKVTIYFINNANFPNKYYNHDIFQENTTTAYARDWRKIIFTHYLGEHYQRLEPELGVVSELVSIKAYVAGSDELEDVVKGKPVLSINHIGTPIAPTDRELGVPPVRFK